jgi:hypothetical protein
MLSGLKLAKAVNDSVRAHFDEVLIRVCPPEAG